ncbi:hypothetical protein HYALB_00000377 [Hymenoscyphus albidus]|uniref:Polyketide synthase n=1 Tax=Hymenoscyphus albidus TaxID=595503 RepID=A0A9N9LG48_9HELO|nr:hypothetical protein HYALB_00000377 [Hymenoscyphus albidus]
MSNEPIAIVGSACRFAGDTNSPSKLWELLKDPKDLRSEIPKSRFSAKGFYHKDGSHHGAANVLHSYLVDQDMRSFDAEFFSIKAAEAKAMDPQQRFLMETVYEGLEAAGMRIGDLQGSDTAVYVGVMCNDYGSMLLRDLQQTPTYLATGTAASILSNRLSYFFDWRGASVTIDTACSSSLVAIHMAVQALRSGDSRVALACGSNLILGPEQYIIESKLNMLSPDGLGRMWDQDANGYARGDGVAAVVLKTLSAAIADGDHIECIIRETGLNQDGAGSGQGLTMPSAVAQHNLIRSTYAKAGLDLSRASDRPQYFEAHGTGTPAGDPVEAEAINNAFFAPDVTENISHDPLYVGSIKTVLGHTEGTAGVAAIMKASLALQNSLIPPNMLFNKLSERVRQFYGPLEILKSAKPWPGSRDLGSSPVRRASVNSFGFGGANAHAILESYDNSTPRTTASESTIYTPFVFSATSERSLKASLSSYSTFLENNTSLNARDLAFTLRQRRSAFGYRAAITATSVDDLRSKVNAKLTEKEAPIGIRALPARSSKKILGVFTGQGAQYARMGAELIEKSVVAGEIIDELERHLAQLPTEDRPAWSLRGEILADSSKTRTGEAAISQPLCTAIQIMLVDLLRLANVNLDIVVGHSSGEIAAAYAAGVLSARDAIRVAYYRGLHLKSAASPNGASIKGVMLAVGTSMEDMNELCADETFTGRIGIAACNSSSSVTISGDEDAIAELQEILEDEKKFNRLLKVDKAYHSNHMLPCFSPYVASLQRCGVKAQTPSESCTWVSSVYEMQVDSSLQLSSTYWAENMTRPVLFSQALSKALKDGAEPDIILEIGPHPALKGPATTTISDVLEKELPYSGILSRGTDAVEASSNGFGFLWSYLSNASVNMDSYEKAMTGQEAFSVIKDLPTYQWNHDQKYWHESRISRKMRLRKDPVHTLLGEASPDSATHSLSWRNLLRKSEMEWLSGHQVQSQTIFPAAGYISTATEASRFMAEEKPIKLIEIKDFIIHQAVVFQEDDSGVEVLISLAEITKTRPDCIIAKFTYSAALGAQPDDLTLAASGDIEISLGEPSPNLLPERKPTLPHMIDVEPEGFYGALAQIGYEFSGRFRSLSDLRRRHGKASCLIKMPVPALGDETLLVHPAELDAAFQSVILAYSYPNDERIRSLHLPTIFQNIRINPSLCGTNGRTEDEFFPVDAAVSPPDGGKGIVGNVNLYNNSYSNIAIQVQGARLVPLGGATAINDRRVFSKVHWVSNKPVGIEAACDTLVTPTHTNTVAALERISTFYLRRFDKLVPENDPLRTTRPTSCYLNFARHVTKLVESGKHPYATKAWLGDTLEDILESTKEFAHLPDARIMHLVGEQMPRVFKGETTILEEFRATSILDDYYAHGFGLEESAKWLGRTVKQITDRYPHMNMLEVGAGTGGATKSIFNSIGSSFLSYTFTDISAAFFENASSVFHMDKMIFKVLNAENDPIEQGYKEGAYDLVVAFFVIHACSKLDVALRNLRRLLKPGGMLVVGEGSHNNQTSASSGFIFGTLPGWWYGVDEGRTLSPLVTTEEWDVLLKNTGFSGVDSTPPSEFTDVFCTNLFVSQAVDETVNFLREPLAAPATTPIEKLVIVGGETERSIHLVNGLKIHLGPLSRSLISYKTLTDVDYSILNSKTTVVSLTELDAPVFKDITPKTFDAVKKMFEEGKTMLWVSSGRRDDEPWSNMPVGFGRTAMHENSELCLQHLDIPDPLKADSSTIAETVLRFQAKIPDNVLWTEEPEIVLEESGKQLVPRLRPINALNDRYNSARRPIIHEIDVSKSPVTIQLGYNGCTMKEISKYETTEPTETLVELRATHSVLSALKTAFGHKFLILGVDNTGVKYIALVDTLASVHKVPAKSAVRVPDSFKESMLAVTGSHLLAMFMLDTMYTGQKLAIHNATTMLADAIAAQASAKDVEVVWTTDVADASTPISWTKLIPYSSSLELSQIVEPDTSCFVGLSKHHIQRSENEFTIASSLPQTCRKESQKTLFSSIGNKSKSSASAILGQTLWRALDNVLGYTNQEQRDLPTSVISLEAVSRGERPTEPMTIIDFTTASLLPVQITRVDDKPMFKDNKSYWVVGLSGALGVSLIDWMVDRGAKNVVLTSRKPQIEASWLATHKSNGGIITILPCDVTNEPGMKAVHKTICDTLPPIAGCLNGAMVLNDTAIRNMSFEQLMNVVKPKVFGSIILDNIFKTINLDFFILVSSINCVVGNLGQANYAAANTFLCSLAAQRRKRGLNGSAVNVGAIIGAGYMERESRRALDLIVQKISLMHLSEEDWHQIFAEAIDVGFLGSEHGPEITTGLSDIPADAPNAPNWFMNPKFSSFIIHQEGAKEDKHEGAATISISDLLEACQTEKEVQKVIRESFANQLRTVLQMTMPDEDLMQMRPNEIGLDSLVSVDIRSWFLKSFQVSIPVLKIMGNDTMATLVQFAVDNVPSELVPSLDDSEDSASSDGRSVQDSSIATTPTQRSASPSYKNNSGFVDWDAESRLPADMQQVISISVPAPTLPPKVILLTGVSGLLGHHLLNYFVKNTPATKVICVAVRKLEERLRTGKLPPRSSAIEYYEGSLDQPLLGLSETEAAAIFAEVDVVVHNGADTSHLKYYRDIKPSNVGSTVTLARLCVPRRIPMHYVSSVGVALFSNMKAFPEISVMTPGSTSPPADGAHGYMSSKYVNERFLEAVNAKYGLRICIHRPSTIVREGEDAQGAKAELDWVNALIHYAKQIKAAPKMEYNKGALDLVYTESCCVDIAKHVFNTNPKPVAYSHQVGDEIIQLGSLQDIGLKTGSAFEVLPMAEWCKKAITAGMHPAVAAVIEAMDERGLPEYPGLLKAKQF